MGLLRELVLALVLCIELPFPLDFTVNGRPQPAMKPVFQSWKLLSNGKALPKPVIFDHGDGNYTYYWDAEKYGEARGVVDWGSQAGAVALYDGDRYTFALATKESSRIIDRLAPVASPSTVLTSPVTAAAMALAAGAAAWAARRRA